MHVTEEHFRGIFELIIALMSKASVKGYQKVSTSSRESHRKILQIENKHQVGFSTLLYESLDSVFGRPANFQLN